jgi:anti-sigma regulatory factor (Ser/Thr protein kinase)
MKLELQIGATHPEYEPARDRLVAFFEAGGLPAETVGELELLLEEVLVNVISYAYAGGEGRIVVTACIDDHAVMLEVRDTGLEFNPLERATPDLEAPIDERRIGGLGLFLITQLASRLTYERRDDTNVLTIVKAI